MLSRKGKVFVAGDSEALSLAPLVNARASQACGHATRGGIAVQEQHSRLNSHVQSRSLHRQLSPAFQSGATAPGCGRTGT